VSSADYASDIALSKGILKQLADVSRKIRNTSRFLLGNLHDFDPAQNAVPYEQLPELDRYMLHRMGEVFAEATDAFETYQFFRFFQTIQNFCVVDLSNFYLDIAKDRLYISAPDAARRRSCQTVLAIALENLARAIAPVLSHLAEDIWQYLPYKTPYKANWMLLIFVGLFAAFVPGHVAGDLTSIGTLLAFVIVCIGIMVMRKSNPDVPRPFKTPLVPLVPILGMVVCSAMIVSLDIRTQMIALAWMVIGLVIYFGYSRRYSKLTSRS